MCGRYAITTAPEAMRSLFRYPDQPNFPPRYNVAPTQPIAVVRFWEGQPRFALVRWGLIPSWVKDPRAFSLLINARGESILEKPAFRSAMRYRRCLIPADGFYEWRKDGERKRPYYVHRRGGGLIAFAGLWEAWSGPNGEEMETAAIVTTAANHTLQPVHHRMPVIVPPEAFDLWLDCGKVDAETALKMRFQTAGRDRYALLRRGDPLFPTARKSSPPCRRSSPPVGVPRSHLAVRPPPARQRSSASCLGGAA